MSDLLQDRIRAHRSAPDVYDPPTFEQMADRIEELEAQVKEDALQYLSDTGQMGETIGDLTRRHEHALRKIDVLEDQLAKAIEALHIDDMRVMPAAGVADILYEALFEIRHHRGIEE